MNADGTDLDRAEVGRTVPFVAAITRRPQRPAGRLVHVRLHGTTCTLDGSPSSDSDGTIASYGWQFEDGTMAWGATVTHTFAGGHNVRLIVMDDEGALAT